MRDSKKGFYAFIYCIGSVKCLYACIYWKKWRFGQVLPMPDTQTTEDRATQLLYSIQFKLSHAISILIIWYPPLRQTRSANFNTLNANLNSLCQCQALGEQIDIVQKKYLLSKSLSLLSLSSTYIRSADSKLSEEHFFPLKCKFFSLKRTYHLVYVVSHDPNHLLNLSLSCLHLIWVWSCHFWGRLNIGDWCDHEAMRVLVAHILKHCQRHHRPRRWLL